MKEHIYSALEFTCKNNNNILAEKFLKKSEKVDCIDLFYDNGILFHIAISHNNPLLVKILLNYMYDTKQINHNPEYNNTEQAVAYIKLKEILNQCKKEYEISSEIDNILKDIADQGDFIFDFDSTTYSSNEEPFGNEGVNDNLKDF